MYHGIINVYKEAGYTSHDVVNRLRHILGQKKIGHTGTLDPDATGVLPVCLGVGTKACDFLMEHTKTYRAVLLLGRTTDTLDTSGKVLSESNVDISGEKIAEIIQSFTGEYEQLPPMYSAIKINGQKLCDMARKGIEVERKRRKVTISEIKINKIELPEVTFTVTCGKGTYIRTLCSDIGELAGCGGCMKKLERTRVGEYKKSSSMRLSEIEVLHKTGRLNQRLGRVDALFNGYPRCYVKQEFDKYLYNGNLIEEDELEGKLSEKYKDADIVRMYLSDESFAGLYEYNSLKKEFTPYKMFLETLAPQKSVIALGKFDACHLGHQELFKTISKIQSDTGLRAMALIISMGEKKILSDSERFEHMRSFGIECIEEMVMSEENRNLSPEDFVKNVLYRKYHAQRIVVGEDFFFGKNRAGDVNTLISLGEKYNYSVHVVPTCYYENRKISSSWIREELEAGNLKLANRLLGYEYEISGYVIHGNRIGRQFGFPTINVLCEGKILPTYGVYAVRVEIDNKTFYGMGNVGMKPTIRSNKHELLETNVFDCDMNLYGEYVRMHLLHFIRPERKFDAVEDLMEQIGKDKKIIKDLLASI